MPVDPEQRRAELAAAVWRVARRSGVDALSVRSVGEEAGWTSGIVQHYFPNKSALLRYAFELVQQRTIERIREIGASVSAEEVLEAIMLTLLPLEEETTAESEVWFAFLGLAVGTPELRQAAERGTRSIVTAMSEQVRRARAAGRVSDSLMDEEVALDLLAFVDGLNVQALFRRDGLDADDLRSRVRRHLARIA
jgi:AcrR family transcriptional regulator